MFTFTKAIIKYADFNSQGLIKKQLKGVFILAHILLDISDNEGRLWPIWQPATRGRW